MPGFYFPTLNSLISKGARVRQRIWPCRDNARYQHPTFALLRALPLNFMSVGSSCHQIRNIWCKLTDRGSSTTKSANLLSIEGGHMKSAIFAAALLTVGCFSLPIFAEQQVDLQEVMKAADALSARESELLSKKDAAGIASLFTSDGLLVTLAPQFAFKPGRDAIQKHYQGIIDAGATSVTLELKNLELRGNDGVWAAVTYSHRQRK